MYNSNKKGFAQLFLIKIILEKAWHDLQGLVSVINNSKSLNEGSHKKKDTDFLTESRSRQIPAGWPWANTTPLT